MALAAFGDDVGNRLVGSPGSAARVHRRLQFCDSIRPFLIPPDQVAHIVAGATVAAFGDAVFRPALEGVGDRDVHLCHVGFYRISYKS